ncbi:MAG: hypothetical protein QXS89_04660 [Sulfolobales archaeon]
MVHKYISLGVNIIEGLNLMACFLAPLTAAIALTIFQRRVARSLSERLKLWILTTILWGGAILLALEHAWHGEIVPYPPFLTAMRSPSDVATALHEISTAGVSMVLASVGVWSGVLGFEKLLSSSISLANRLKFGRIYLRHQS